MTTLRIADVLAAAKPLDSTYSVDHKAGFTKTIRIGKVMEYRGHNLCKTDVFCKITYTDGRLSISGVVGPQTSGNCRGSCGQINMGLKIQDFVEFADGWDGTKLGHFLKAWEEHHLNDLTAGSPAQETHLKALPKVDIYEAGFSSHYDGACAELEKAGMQPDPTLIHQGKPYRYGSAWLRCDVPLVVLAFLQALPDTDTTPAWV